MKRQSRQNGFGAIAAIMILVVLGALAAGIVKFGAVQGMGSAQDIASSAAWQAARAGTEWGLYQAMRPGRQWSTLAGCNANAVAAVTFQVGNGMLASVKCEASDYNEGEILVSGTPQPQVTRRFVITAVACSAAGACPDAAAAVTPSYVERMRQVTAACTVDRLTDNCQIFP